MTVKLLSNPTTEAQHQRNVIVWSQIHRDAYPELALLFHIPNGGSRDKVEAAHLKAQGTKAGIPDLCLPVSRRGYHGLFAEMKTPKGRLSQEQKWWGEKLTAQGYLWCVCYGWTEAVGLLEWYLSGGA